MGLNGVYNEVDEFMAGQVVYMAGGVIPTGYLECNGATVSRSTYGTLFAAIGVIYGPGDGATTFHLPDLRGEFLRGADKGRGVDSGRVVGSAQGDLTKAHKHDVQRPAITVNESFAGGSTLHGKELTGFDGNSNTSFSGGGETRPRNVAMVPCIKY